MVSGARAYNESTIDEVCRNPLFILQDQHHIGILVRALHFVRTSYGLQTHTSSGAKRTNFYQADSAQFGSRIIISMMKLRDMNMDIDTEQGKVQMVPLIAIIACHSTEAAVAVSETFGPHFLQIHFFNQKYCVALSHGFT